MRLKLWEKIRLKTCKEIRSKVYKDKFKFLILVTVYILCAINFAGSLPQKTSPSHIIQNNVQEQKDSPNDKRIYQSSQFLTYNEKTKIYHIWGNVKIRQKDTVLTAEDAIYNEVTREGLITVNPKLTQPGATITGDKMRVFYKEHKAVVEGNVHGIYDSKDAPRKPGTVKPGTQTTPANPKVTKGIDEGPIHLYAPYVEFYWDKNQGKATGGVKIVQIDRTITADLATFDNKSHLVTFTGNVVVHKGTDDSLTSQKLTLNVLTNESVAEGNVEAIVMVEEEENKQKSSKSKKDQPTKKDQPEKKTTKTQPNEKIKENSEENVKENTKGTEEKNTMQDAAKKKSS